MKLLGRLIILMLSIAIAAYLLPGVIISGAVAVIIAGVVLAIINTFLRPILVILTLPINILSLGLFTFFINAFLVLLASLIVDGFAVVNFWWALLFSIVVAIINGFLILILKEDKGYN